MTATEHLVINQVYGRVWQGEGPSTGELATVIRLMGCNLTCDWTAMGGSPCDESQTWNARRYNLHMQGTRMAVPEILAKVERGRLAIVTGGEPLLHQDQPGWGLLLAGLGRMECRIEVETNGTQVPDQGTVLAVTQFNVSPKLDSSGVARSKRDRPEAIYALRDTGNAYFKFVCRTRVDVRNVSEWAARYDVPAARVWVMPEGTEAGTILRTARILAPMAAGLGYNLTLRQQHLVHGIEGEPRD